jgi:hypothetical protein
MGVSMSSAPEDYLEAIYRIEWDKNLSWIIKPRTRACEGCCEECMSANVPESEVSEKSNKVEEPFGKGG